MAALGKASHRLALLNVKAAISVILAATQEHPLMELRAFNAQRVISVLLEQTMPCLVVMELSPLQEWRPVSDVLLALTATTLM